MSAQVSLVSVLHEIQKPHGYLPKAELMAFLAERRPGFGRCIGCTRLRASFRTSASSLTTRSRYVFAETWPVTWAADLS